MEPDKRRNDILLKTNELIKKNMIMTEELYNTNIEYNYEDVIELEDKTFNNIDYIIFKVNPLYKQIKKNNFVSHIITSKFNYNIYYLLYDNLNYYISGNYIDKILYEFYIKSFNKLCSSINE